MNEGLGFRGSGFGVWGLRFRGLGVWGLGWGRVLFFFFLFFSFRKGFGFARESVLP